MAETAAAAGADAKPSPDTAANGDGDAKGAKDSFSTDASTVADLPRLRRRADLRILPIAFALYTASWWARGAIASAAVANAEKGHSMLQTLGMNLDQFNWASSAFFFGVVAFEIPSNLLLKLTSPSRWLAGIAVAWGIITACTAAVANYGGLVACSTLLGFAQAGLVPGVVYHFTFWYPRTERGLRIAAFWIAGPFASALGGLLNAGIVQLDGAGGLYGWRWLFLIYGLLSIVLGVACWLLLPDYPRTAKWLGPGDAAAIEASLKGEAGSEVSGQTWVKEEAAEFFRNPLSYLFAVMMAVGAAARFGLVIYAPTIISSLGFSSTAAIAMTSPLYFWGLLWIVALGYLADRTRDRFFLVTFAAAVPLLGYALLSALQTASPGAKLALLFVVATTVNGVGNLVILWRTDSARGTTYTALCSGFTLAVGSIGGAVAPQVFRPGDAPGFRVAFAVLAACEGACILGAAGVRWIERRWPSYCGPDGPVARARVIPEAEVKGQP